MESKFQIKKERIIMEKLIKILEKKIEEIKKGNPKGLTQYAEGKIDGINLAIREIEKSINC
jgi:hypothetical protein